MHPHNKHERENIGRRKGFKRSKGYWNDFKWVQDRNKARKLLELNAQRHKDTTKLCSCFMCGNPRRNKLGPKWRGLTMPEIKDVEFVESELEELNENGDNPAGSGAGFENQ